MSLDYARTELLPTIVPLPSGLDPSPVLTRHGRAIPGPEYAARDLDALLECIQDGAETPLPTVRQLGRIALNPHNGCWELPTYQDARNRARYGSLRVKGIPAPSSLAHRTMFMIFYGIDALPNGRWDFLDHLCEIKACCYPRHLEIVTLGVNTRRGMQRIALGQLTLEI